MLLAQVAQGTVEWLPSQLQTLVRIFNLVGSVIGSAALVLLMSWEWGRLQGLGQRLRYWTLLGYSVTVVGGTAEQLYDRTQFAYRNLGTLLVTISLLFAVAVTYRDAYRDHQKKKPRPGAGS